MSDMPRRLPDGELEVMQAIWDCTPPVTRSDIDGRLKPTHPMAQTTLLTVLTRLADKGFVRIDKEGRSARYTPLVSREDYLSLDSRSVLSRLYGSSPRNFVAALARDGLPPGEVDELRARLDELERAPNEPISP